MNNEVFAVIVITESSTGEEVVRSLSHFANSWDDAFGDLTRYSDVLDELEYEYKFDDSSLSYEDESGNTIRCQITTYGLAEVLNSIWLMLLRGNSSHQTDTLSPYLGDNNGRLN